MKYLLIFVLYVASITQLHSQDLESRLSFTDHIECAVYAENSSALIGSYNIFEIDSVVAVLDIWERECGKSEPILRLRMLHSIYHGDFESQDYIDYYEQYIRKYIYRVTASERTTAQSSYQQSKIYFDHTPLGNGFDLHTSVLANYLLSLQEENSDAYLICLLLTDEIEAFKEKAYNRSLSKSPLIKSLYDSQYSLFVNFRLSGGLGLWMPIGSNKESFGSSPMISIGVHQRINSKWRLDGIFSLVPFVNNKELDFRFEGRDETTGSLVSLNLSLGVTREYEISQCWFIDTGFSLGVNILNTDIESRKEEQSDQALATMDMGIKVALRHKLNNGKSIAIQSGVHYAAYNWSSRLKSEVGNSYTSLGLVYGF